MNEAQTDTQLSRSTAVGGERTRREEGREGGRRGRNASAGSARRESKGTRQIAQGHFLFPWSLQSDPIFLRDDQKWVRSRGER